MATYKEYRKKFPVNLNKKGLGSVTGFSRNAGLVIEKNYGGKIVNQPHKNASYFIDKDSHFNYIENLVNATDSTTVIKNFKKAKAQF